MDAGELAWTDEDWKAINDAVVQEAGRVRVAQKVFPTALTPGDPKQVDDEQINFATMSIAEGVTKPFVELYLQFTLTTTQVKQESNHGSARTLARMVAKSVAASEDQYIFQNSSDIATRTAAAAALVPPGSPIPALLRPPMNVDNWRGSVDLGLLEAANPATASDALPAEVSVPIAVPRLAAGGAGARRAAAVWGENTFTAVSRGISKLVAKGQASPYALILPTAVYADTFAPPSPASLVTTADRIKPLVDGGFLNSGVLPDDQGLLVALAGDPIMLFVGRESTVEYLNKSGGSYNFRVVERIQYVVRDPRAMVLLTFQ